MCLWCDFKSGFWHVKPLYLDATDGGRCQQGQWHFPGKAHSSVLLMCWSQDKAGHTRQLSMIMMKIWDCCWCRQKSIKLDTRLYWRKRKQRRARRWTWNRFWTTDAGTNWTKAVQGLLGMVPGHVLPSSLWPFTGDICRSVGKKQQKETLLTWKAKQIMGTDLFLFDS